jgi:hypothetical protein
MLTMLASNARSPMRVEQEFRLIQISVIAKSRRSLGCRKPRCPSYFEFFEREMFLPASSKV